VRSGSDQSNGNALKTATAVAVIRTIAPTEQMNHSSRAIFGLATEITRHLDGHADRIRIGINRGLTGAAAAH